MKRFLVTAICLGWFMTSTTGRGASAGSDSATNQELAVSAAHRAMLERFGRDHRQAFLRGNVALLAPYWADGVRVMPEYHPTLMNKADAASYYRALFEHFTVTACDRTPLGAMDLGPKVVEIGRFSLTLGVRGQAEAHDATGKYLEIWDKTAGGGLALATVAWNFDRYPPFAQELRFTGLAGVRQAMQAHLPIDDPLTLDLAALLKIHELAVVEGNHRVWTMLYADDAVLLPNHHAAIEGREAIAGYLAAHEKELPVFEKLDLRHDRIDDLGRFAIEYGSHVANWRQGDSSGVNTGKAIRVWRRESHGGLRVLWSIAMYD